MAKITGIYFKSKKIKKSYKNSLDVLCNWFEKEFSEFHELKIIESDTSLHHVIGHNDLLKISSKSGLLGFAENTIWDKEGEFPDGNYFIYREWQFGLELLSDFSGSRTIWYHQSEDFFIFSSSQFSIIKFLGDYSFNCNVVSWMLSSGSLGSNNSWDNRLNILPRNTFLRWNAIENQIETFQVSSKFIFESKKLPRIEKVIEESISSVSLPSKNVGHLLSGGLESRLLFYYLAIPRKLKAFTWTRLEFLNDPKSDVSIAQKLCKVFGLEHSVISLEDVKFNPSENLDLFIKYGEGRIDHLSGYTDGFSLWKNFKNEAFHIIIRGDHNFGRYKSNSPIISRKILGCEFADDYSNVGRFLIKNQDDNYLLKIFEQESLSDYSVRLGLDYRHQYVNSALSDLKLSFVEIYNPLLNNRLLEYSVKIPSKLSENKRITRNLMNRLIPNFAYASKTSIGSLDSFLSENYKDYFILLLTEVQNETWQKLGLNYNEIQKLLVRSKKKNSRSDKSIFLLLKKFIPIRIKKYLLPYRKNEVSEIRLLFRIYLIVTVFQKLSFLKND